MMRALMEERISQLKNRPGCEFPDDVRRLLRTRLTSHRCPATDIADLLAIDRRTLSRRLQGGGTGYRAMTNEISFEIACQLLEDTVVPLGQIAAALGYSEAALSPAPSAAGRAKRRPVGAPRPSWVTRRRPKLSKDCPC